MDGKLVCIEKALQALRHLQQGELSHRGWGHGMALSYSLMGRVGINSVRSSIILGAPNQARPEEDAGANCGGDQSAPGAPNLAVPDEGTGTGCGEKLRS